VPESGVTKSRYGGPVNALAERLGLGGAEDERSTASEAIADRLLSAGLVLGFAALLAQTVIHVANDRFLGTKVLFDANDDASAFTWLSVTAEAAASTAIAVYAASGRVRRRFLVLAAALAFLSLDDEVALHERTAVVVRRDFLGLPDDWINRVVWPAIYLPILAAAFILLWDLSQRAYPAARKWLRVGLGLLVAGVALEVLTAPLPTTREDGGWPYTIETAIEEGVEFLGWAVIASAAVAVAAVRLYELGSRKG
jgi:hypothetical protein